MLAVPPAGEQRGEQLMFMARCSSLDPVSANPLQLAFYCAEHEQSARGWQALGGLTSLRDQSPLGVKPNAWAVTVEKLDPSLLQSNLNTQEAVLF